MSAEGVACHRKTNTAGSRMAGCLVVRHSRLACCLNDSATPPPLPPLPPPMPPVGLLLRLEVLPARAITPEGLTTRSSGMAMAAALTSRGKAAVSMKTKRGP